MTLHNMERIVVTGMGAVTPFGIGADTYFQGLLSGKSCVAPITRYDTTDLPVHLAAEVPNFNPKDFLDGKLASKMTLSTQFGCVAAKLALEDSHLTLAGQAVGIVVGTALGASMDIAQAESQWEKRGRKKISGMLVPQVLSNITATQIAVAHGLTGPTYTLQNACGSGDDAVGLSAMLLFSHRAKAMIAVGCEAATSPMITASLATAGVLCTDETGDDVVRPFDKHRKGFVLGEGGGALLLERESDAKARGAKIYGVVLGYGSSQDGYHITSPREDGLCAANAMETALEQAQLAPDAISYINAHGTGTLLGDRCECTALAHVFGKEIPPISSSRGAVGHMMAAGSILDSITCLLALREQILPPTLNFTEQAEDCPVDCIPNVPRKTEVRYAMNNAFGFGGQNASLVFGKNE